MAPEKNAISQKKRADTRWFFITIISPTITAYAALRPKVQRIMSASLRLPNNSYRMRRPPFRAWKLTARDEAQARKRKIDEAIPFMLALVTSGVCKDERVYKWTIKATKRQIPVNLCSQLIT